MSMNVQHPILPKATNEVQKIDVMIEHSLKIFRGVLAKRYSESTPPWRMIGALGDKNYVTPANDKWRYDESQSDDEELTLKKMMEDKFGRKKLKIFGDTDDEDDDDDGGDDEGGEGGDGGNVGASGASTRSGGNDESESDDNLLEPGYEHYIDERGIMQVRRIRTDQDEDYVPSDTEAERLKKKKTAIRRKKKMKKRIGTSSAEPAAAQHETITEPVHEASVNPEFGFTAEETTATMALPSTATEPPPAATTAAETPSVTRPADPQHGTSSSNQHRSATHQRNSKRCGKLFSEMAQDEKVEFLFLQLQAAAGQINRHSEFMSANRNTVLKQQVEINTLKETVGRQ
ncbi:hypothetical protein HanRHA438_Chr03g0119751 [Helianthus annuus]|uniref:Uncharacterized protein n=1 Tax=Helianthus annuus TaxID=4232 RepID=A0A9K3NVS1_HELAN|nr:zinc finger protein hangover-like [Helianthus annuus]KAF5814249.1 hypothetical protein HanXRQr2_Chr03g0108921 [Helianthus annuus]KAJ0592903.1 hypothetical protein HanHA300_Chr03g0091061 [Helianthus annuus]KAJ0600605.1 hypothetical protein HanIR_Chr03g0118991 [Helianthus annuus]KAJ0607906.1 hypothetical protein HanHA89_Chr03g0102701 [Helianthus annuus]KAJ0767972.1 hypothetical protein HanLR1_Chr03g0096091 [Helianthus annuus]